MLNQTYAQMIGFRWIGAVLVVVCLLVCNQSRAEPTCDPVSEVDRFRYLRQLSLDLWGRVPSKEELHQWVDADDISEAHIDSMLDSDEFNAFVGRYHRDLLWPNVELVDLINGAYSFLFNSSDFEMGDADSNRLFSVYIGLYERGALVPCADTPALFDKDGEIFMEPWPDGSFRDGWVMVEPYWAPNTKVKVCALEARVVSEAASGGGCHTVDGFLTGGCGCGPELERCADFEAIFSIKTSLQQQVLRTIQAVVEQRQPYHEFLTEPGEVLNGALIHYYRHIVPMANDPVLLVPPVAPWDLPTDVAFNDPEWRYFSRGPQDSGILTSLLYLLRFQTARARANRYWDAFLCQPFQAPETDLPSPNEPCSLEPNLRLRCGCNHCHSALEPASAYWARFADAGTLFLDPMLFPNHLEECATCGETDTGCLPLCERYYLT